MVRIVDRLRQRSQASFFGRAHELQTFKLNLSSEAASVNVFLIHGAGGMGKTALLEQMVSHARQVGLTCVRLDGRDLEPSVHGLLQGLATALGLPPSQAQLPHILHEWRQQPRRLLAIDTFEHLAHLSQWLRDQLLAELPQQSLAIISGRGKPSELWQTDPTWRHGSQVIHLRKLSTTDSARALAAKGLDEAQCQAITRLSHGHPLTLMLLADLVEAQGTVPESLGTDVIRRLTDCFAAQAPSPLHREALEFCAHARITTEDLLAATVDQAAAPALFDWLASLNFMELAPEGLFPHDLVRDAISAELRWRAPQRVAEGANKLLRYYLSQTQSTTNPSLRSLAALDIFFLTRGHPVMKRFVDFATLGSVSSERATLQDMAPIADLVRKELGPSHEALVQQWQDHEAATWWIVRAPEGSIMAAMLILELSGIPPQDQADDPALQQLQPWIARQAPLRSGDRVLHARMAVVRSTLANPGICINALQIRNFLMWMTEPAVALFAITNVDPDHWRPMMSHLDFQLIHGPGFEMDGQRHGTFAHDWRAVPQAEWLDRMGSGTSSSGKTEGDAARTAPSHQTLPEQAFKAAVHDALRQWQDPSLLGRNPLLSSRLVQSGRRPPEDAKDTLRRLIRSTADTLSEHPRQMRFMRTIELTYWRPAGSQELAAERLGLPFGTYRYQLRMAIDRLGSALWLRENDDASPASTTPD
ncbi:MAG: ATP-binding protein [Aquabacterium sp.]|uniref:ATP-binding protein n=1 Tax=Aquabacterium sp. TaxID=1872578 RepID=UPI0027208A6C|nr:ATP-binding protein [Aquabacterium sp.]MDO9005847.1 ATP-binding protein [Aquabacterium sp.]